MGLLLFILDGMNIKVSRSLLLIHLEISPHGELLLKDKEKMLLIIIFKRNIKKFFLDNKL